ncbi:MAG: hypothetical protein A6D91_10790, partial [Bacillaceae bacterium G1]
MNGGFGYFRNPTQVSYAMGVAKTCRQIIDTHQFKSILIITDPGVRRAGLVDSVTEQLSGLSYAIFDQVEPNPTVANCDNALKVLREIQADLVIAIGGGSPIDVAKAVCMLATNGGSVVDYEGIDKFRNDILPLMAIPTTAGTASEVTSFAVITDEARQYKLTVGSVKLTPRWALVDPELTRTMPKSITAATGLDALVHAIESYTSKMANGMTKPLAREAIRLISSSLRQAVYDGDNMVARDRMMLGSLLAGLAFNNTRLGNCHALSHPVSAIYHVPHGVANAILIPHVMEFNAYAVPELFADIAADMGQNLDGLTMMEKAYAAVEAVADLARDIGIPERLSEYNVEEDQIERMAKDAMLSGNIAGNSRKKTIEDVIE